MKILYLPIEILDRELPARLLVALEAVSKNFLVCIIDQNELKYNLDSLPRGAILHKDHTDCNVYPVFKKAKSLGFTTCSLDEEGLVYFNEEHFARARIGKACINETDVVFAWGPDQYSILTKNIKNESISIVSSGNPRFDIHVANREKRKNYLPQKKILINTRFGSVNSGLNLNQDGYIERMRSLDEVKTKEDEMFRREYFDFMLKLYDFFESMIEELAEKLPNYRITIRPHPAESSEPYLTVAAKYKNVTVSKSCSLEQDLLSHDVLIHNGCTTGIEAVATQIKTIVYEPIQAPNGDMALPNFFGKKASSVRGVIEEVLSDDGVDFDNDLVKMNGYISSLDNANSHKKIVSVINKSFDDNYGVDIIRRFKLQKNYPWYIKNLIKYAPGIVLSETLRKKKLQWNYILNKFPVTKIKVIKEFVRDIYSLKESLMFDIPFEDVKIKKVGIKSFILYSEMKK